MKNVIRCMAVLALCSISHVWAGSVVRIAGGDCDALSAAAGSAPGSEPSLIVLTRNGFYGCAFTVNGNIVIDGAGAGFNLGIIRSDSGLRGQIVIAKGASLTLRQLNIGTTQQNTATQTRPDAITDFGPILVEPEFVIDGSLVLDSVSLFNNTVSYDGIGYVGGGLFANGGDLTLRNVTLTGNYGAAYSPLILGTATVSHSTIAANYNNPAFGDGNISISNSIVAGNTQGCARSAPLTSLGGNVTDDASCGLDSTNDRLVSDAHLLELDRHGGVVENIALRNDSPAIGNGVLFSCEGTDSRGFSRGQAACDSGAYEFGGDNGQLSATGMSGLYFNSSNDGHYVSIQRLHNDTALVIWNTFDENGVPAWLYGVGSVSGTSIHVDQMARNSGGKLMPGGGVVGSQASAWGSIDVNLHDCYDAQLSYHSTDPGFGSGSTPLTRLAFLDGVNCAP